METVMTILKSVGVICALALAVPMTVIAFCWLNMKSSQVWEAYAEAWDKSRSRYTQRANRKKAAKDAARTAGGVKQ